MSKYLPGIAYQKTNPLPQQGTVVPIYQDLLDSKPFVGAFRTVEFGFDAGTYYWDHISLQWLPLAGGAPPLPTYTSTYTTTPQDYEAKCGQGTSGDSVTRSGTSHTSQGDADNQAYYQAINAITCPYVPPTFNTTFNPGDNISTVTWNASSGTLLKLNLPLSTNTAPNPATMQVFAPDGVTQVGSADYNGADTGIQCGIVYQGVSYYKTLVNGALILI